MSRDQLAFAMIYLYKTRPCPNNKNGGVCPFTEAECFDYHDGELRRRSPVRRRNWNYSSIEKCNTGYRMPSKCNDRCRSHHTLAEINFHPNEYKRQPCPLGSKCFRGPMCWFYHEEAEKMNFALPNSAEEASINWKQPPPAVFVEWFNRKKAQKKQQEQPVQNGEGASPKRQPPPQQQSPPQKQQPQQSPHASQVRQPPPSGMPNEPEQKDGEKRRDGPTEQAHQQWLQSMAKFLRMFKYQKCEAAECPKHFNCMRYHGDEDKRRALKSEKDDSLLYKAEPCPHLFDYWGSQTFMHNYSCSDGLDCQYAHNWYELGYHYKTYKTVACPYLKLASSIDAYQTKQCPFVRDAAFVESNFGGGMHGIKRVKNNNLITMNNAQVAAIDMCPFYHNETERRYHDDPPFPPYKSSSSKKHHAQPQPHQHGQQQQQQQQYGQQPQPPPHMFQQQQQQQQQQNMPPPSQNQVPPHLMGAQPYSQPQQQSQTLYGPGPPPQQKSDAQLQADQAERQDFADELGVGNSGW